MGRFFNTAGPCQPVDHYTLDPMSRLTAVRQLVDNKRYFVLHAPRQTGKTTTMISFVNALNQEGKYIALYINVEPAQPFATMWRRPTGFSSVLWTIRPASTCPVNTGLRQIA